MGLGQILPIAHAVYALDDPSSKNIYAGIMKPALYRMYFVGQINPHLYIKIQDS